MIDMYCFHYQIHLFTNSHVSVSLHMDEHFDTSMVLHQPLSLDCHDLYFYYYQIYDIYIHLYFSCHLLATKAVVMDQVR